MRLALVPACGFALLAAILIAAFMDLAILIGHALEPWLGWMLP